MPRPLLTVCLALPVRLSSLQTIWNTLSYPAFGCHKLTQSDLYANNNRKAFPPLNSAVSEGGMMLSDMTMRQQDEINTDKKKLFSS